MKSKGKCVFCGKEYTASGMSKHLEEHLQEKAVGIQQHGLSFHIKVTADKWMNDLPYFLNILADGNATLKDVDDFLRKIWLECCGHLSSFETPRKLRTASGLSIYEALDLYEREQTEAHRMNLESFEHEIPKIRKLRAILSKGLKIDYEYDMGSTTCLQLSVLSELPIQADKKIVLLSRNEPLEVLCSHCHTRSAASICVVCDSTEDALFCRDCAREHERTCPDFKDYAHMPVVNSPRMGVCGYIGGTIDKARDGIYQYDSL